MKKFLSIALAAIMLITPSLAIGQRGGVGYEGGVRRNERDENDTKQYKEVIYVSKEPVELEGTLQTRIDRRGVRYKYELSSKDNEVELSRSIRLDRDLRPSDDYTQVVEVNNLNSYDETITTEDGEYVLDEYQFYNSTIDDNQPVVTHYQGSWNGKKVYKLNEEEGTLTVNISGNINGFEQFWGGVEHQNIESEYRFEAPDQEAGDGAGETPPTDESSDWTGRVTTRVLANKTLRDRYIPHSNTTSSFDGIFTLSESENMTMVYDYDLPLPDSGSSNYRNIGSGEISLDITPTQEQLYIPRYRDIKGHWAESYIKKLAGLKALDLSKEYFLPDEYISREEFAVYLAKALRLEEIESTSTRGQADELPRFEDIGLRHPNYDYIQNIKNRRIMTGVGDNMFSADSYLTRQEAATIIARSLGIERIAPNFPFQTHYRDDREIATWAKKGAYAVYQVGIMHGYNGKFSPNTRLTRAEATALIERLIDYIRYDIKDEYGL